MEQKDRKDINETEESSKKTPDDQVPEKKYSEENNDKNIINIKPEDLDEILKQLKERFDLDDDNIKIVKIERKKTNLKDVIYSTVISFLFDLILIVSLDGFIGYAEENFSLIIFSLIFSVIELIFRKILMKYFFRLMFQTLGLIIIPITIFSFLIAWLITPGLYIESEQRLILFFILFSGATS
jgi:hypothetical protein